MQTDQRTQNRESGTQRGQTLIEVLVAVGILLAGVIAVITLSIASLKADQLSSRKIVALNLAREAAEVLRNIRDSNWLAGMRDDCSISATNYTDDWFRGVSDDTQCAPGAQDIILRFDTMSYQWESVGTAAPLTDGKIYFLNNGTYVQGAPLPAGTTSTIYTRYVTLTPRDSTSGLADEACVVTAGKCSKITHYDVLVTVTSALNTQTDVVQIGSKLYNWKP